MLYRSLPNQCWIPVPAACTFTGLSDAAKAALFLFWLARRTQSDPDCLKRGYWVNIGSTKLRELLGGQYKVVIDELVALGVIEVNDRYSSSGANRYGRSFCKSYRFAKPHRDGLYSLFELTKQSHFGCQDRHLRSAVTTCGITVWSHNFRGRRGHLSE